MIPNALESSTVQFKNKRTIETIHCKSMTHWQDYPLTGFQLTQYSLDKAANSCPAPTPAKNSETTDINKITKNNSVILFPSILSSLKSGYSDRIILKLLELPHIDKVYEARYQYDGHPHQLHAESAINDIKHIAFDPLSRPLVVGLDGGAALIAAGIWEASQLGTLYVRGCQLIAPHIPQYDALLAKHFKAKLKALAATKELMTDSGYAMALYNVDSVEKWFNRSTFKHFLANLKTSPFKNFPFPTQIQYYCVDTLNKKGKRLLNLLFTPQMQGNKLLGIHPLFLKNLKTEKEILSFCQRCL